VSRLTPFFLALRDTLIEEPLLFLCDNQSLLKAVNRWIGEGGKATLVGAPDADILAPAIEILRKRIAAGTATFLVKVKAHRGKPANERAVHAENKKSVLCLHIAPVQATWDKLTSPGNKTNHDDASFVQGSFAENRVESAQPEFVKKRAGLG